MTKDSDRYIEIDILRGIAIFLVVLGHSVIVYPVNLHDVVWCKALHDLIYSFHMGLFFAISGWCYNYDKEKGYLHYLGKKIRRLLIPYLFFSMLDYAVRKLFSTYVNRSDISWKTILLYGGNYWFIYVLLLILVIYPLLDAIPLWWIKMALALFAYLMASKMPELFCLNLIFNYLFFFYAGRLIREKRVVDKLKALPECLKIGLFLLFVALWICMFTYGSAMKSIGPLLVSLLGLFMILMLPLISGVFPLIRWFSYFGKTSLPMYLVEGFLLTATRTVVVNALGISNPLVIIMSIVIVDFFMSGLFVKLFVYKLKHVRFLFGL